MVATAAFPERLIAVYEGALLGLDLLAGRAAGDWDVHSGPTRLTLGYVGTSRLAIGLLYTHPLARGRGCASALLRALVDTADRLDWTLLVDLEAAVGGDACRASRLFERFGFRLDGGLSTMMTRHPGTAWHQHT